MKIFWKVTIILIFSSAIFGLIRVNSFFEIAVSILVSNLGGITYLYATVGIIFAILAASIIIFQSQRWDNLSDATKGEVSELNELWQWSVLSENSSAHSIDAHIRQYLTTSVENVQFRTSLYADDQKDIIFSLRKDILRLSKHSQMIGGHLLHIFDNFIECRTRRINFTHYVIPTILMNLLLLNTALLIIFSYFIGIHNTLLNYVFLMGVVVLSSAIYCIIEDMNYPLRPGAWQIKMDDFEKLLYTMNPKPVLSKSKLKKNN